MSCQCYQIGGPFIAEDPDCPAHGTEAQAREREREAELDSLRADAARYRWLRDRLKVKEERSLAGSYRDSIYVRVGQSFFDTPTRGSTGYVDPAVYAVECMELDAAIDAAMKERT